MDIVWGIVLLVLGLLAWVGQSIVWLWPETGVRLGLAEAEADVDPVFWADVRGEAAWDALVTWTLPAAGLLLMGGNTLRVLPGFPVTVQIRGVQARGLGQAGLVLQCVQTGALAQPIDTVRFLAGMNDRHEE